MFNKKDNSATTVTDPPVGGTIQIGSIVAYYGKVAPATWLLCDGSKIPDVCDTLIGMVGEYTPDLNARILMGTGTGTDDNNNTATVSLGGSGGEYTNTLKLTQIPSHQHLGWGEKYATEWGTGNSSSAGYYGASGSDKDDYLYGSTFTGGTPGGQIATTNGTVTGTSAGDTTAHNNVQPYLGITYIIYAGTN